MSKVVQKLQQGMVLSLMMGAIAACQPASDTAEQSAADTSPEQTTEPAETSEPTANPAEPSKSDDEAVASTTTNSSASSTQPKAPEPKPVPKLPAECDSPETQLAMNTCAQAEYAQADVQLNNAYQALKAQVSGEQAEQLITAEEAWIAYRDLYCEFVQAQFDGGSIQPLIYAGCMTQLTQNRTALLAQTAPPPPSFEVADQALNTTYQDLQAALSLPEQEQLIDAQLAWINYRDVHCVFEGGDRNVCFASVTVFQTQHLQDQIESRSL